MKTAGELAHLDTDPPGLGGQLATLLADYHRAHLIGPGFGSEHGVGIALAPERFNLNAQNKGIEQVLRAWQTAGTDLQVSVRATATRHVIPLADGSHLHIDILTGVTYEIQRFGSGGEPMGGVRSVEYAIGAPPNGVPVVVQTDIPGLTADGYRPGP